MTLNVFDHAIVILLVILFPIADYFAMRHRAERIHAGESNLRMGLYRKILKEEWIGAVVVVAAWFALGRSAGELGLVPETGPAAWAGYGLAALVCALLVLQARTIIGNTERESKIREQIGWLSFLMPHTRQERKAFDGVSVTAGVCEELLFRGYLIAYVIASAGTPFWVAALVSSAAFGFAHAYQGPTGIMKSGAVGLLMAVLYGLTGSLWAPILVHSVMDLTSGRIGFAAMSGGVARKAA